MKDEVTRDDRVANLKGLGCSRKRVEDARFTQGKGNYVDDINLPGMLHGDFVRSPYAHARVTSINTDAAMALDGVIAVLTAKDLEPLSLHWMPTLAGDKQMVLADGKVLFQGQEVAFVVAKDRYIAADAVELVEVEYEELPVIVDPFKEHFIGHAVVQVFAGVDFIAEVDAAVFGVVQDGQPATRQFVECLFHEAGGALRPGIDIGPGERA